MAVPYPQDLRMAGRCHTFSGDQHFLVKPLARPEAGISNLDVLVRLEPGQAYEVGGQIHDPHRFAHVEDEDLTMPAERARLHDQLGGFGNGHEIAPHVGMGDQDRAPRPDLPEERRDHAAAAAQHIAEAYRYEVAPVLDGGLLHYELGHALGKTHHAAGTYRLVSGHADEVLRPGLDRGGNDVEGAEHIVEDRIADFGLNQRNMLVCGGVKDGARLVGPDEIRH